MNILVTGGAGFIGSHLTDLLLEDGHTVIVADNLSTGVREHVHGDAEFVEMDICDEDKVTQLLTAMPSMPCSMKRPRPWCPIPWNIPGKMQRKILWAS